MITTNTYSKELCHIGIKLGAQRENHKYVARVETKPGKYLYFYDMNRYNSWKNGAKNNLKTAANNFKNKITDKVSGLRGKSVNQITKRLAESKVKVSEAFNKYKDLIKSNTEKASTKVKETISAEKKAALQEVKKNITPTVNKISSKISETGKKAVIETKNITNKISEKIDKIIKSNERLKLRSVKQSKESKESSKNIVSNIANAYVRTMGNGLYNIVNLRNKDTQPVIRANPKKKNGDYLAEVEYPDGRVVKIKKKSDWDRYAEVFKYQNNEKSFMHSVPEIKLNPDGSMPSSSEDRAEVNEKVNSGGNRTVNCVYCSTAYELRRRGYDVEAPDLRSTIGPDNISTLFDIRDSVVTTRRDTITTDHMLESNGNPFVAATLKNVKKNPDGTYSYVYSVQHYDLLNLDKNVTSFVPAKDVINAFSTDSGSTTDSSWEASVRGNLKTATKDFPVNSRGMINVYWKNGGGHSMVWEKDEHGKITIYDTQWNETVDYVELMKKVNQGAPVQFVRTDNAELKPGVLSRITAN